MKTINKDKQIIELLKEGKSYTYIQEVLQVSPSKIAMIRKNLFSDSSSENISTSSSASSSVSNSDNFSTTTDDNIENYDFLHDNKNNVTTKNKNIENINFKKTTMENQNNDVEKLKLELNHNLELKKLELQQESFDIQRRDLQIKKSIVDLEKQKIEREGKTLIYKFRKLMLKYKKCTMTYLQLDDYVNNLNTLFEDIDEYCFKEDIDKEELIILSILNKTIDTFEDYLEKLVCSNHEECSGCEDFGDCEDCEFEIDESEAEELKIQISVDSAAQKMIDQSQTIDFDDYDF